MDLKEYSQNISEFLPETNFEPFELQISMKESRHWSEKFGQLLYDFSMGELPPIYEKTEIDAYLDWANASLPVLEQQLLEKIEDDHYRRAYQEINFHWLNSAMINSWRPIVNFPNKNQHERVMEIKTAQDLIAVWCLPYFEKREKLSSENSNIAYFSPENTNLRKATESRLNEADTAIALLDIMLQEPDLTFVPGPAQYEKAPSINNGDYKPGENINSDFLAIDSQKRQIIGIQTATQVTDEKFKKYDPNRVVLIDGRVDLGNIKAVKVRPRTADKKIVSWSGMRAMSHIKSIKTAGKQHSRVADYIGPQELFKLKNKAHFALGKIAVDKAKIRDIVWERIQSKMYQ